MQFLSNRKPCASVGISADTQNPVDSIDANLGLDKPSGRLYLPLVTTNEISEAARILGRIKSPKRAKASRENGKLGGRPPSKGKKKKAKRAA